MFPFGSHVTETMKVWKNGKKPNLLFVLGMDCPKSNFRVYTCLISKVNSVSYVHSATKYLRVGLISEPYVSSALQGEKEVEMMMIGNR